MGCRTACWYKLKEEETVELEFSREYCPATQKYVIGIMKRFEVRDREGNLVVDFLKSDDAEQTLTDEKGL